MNFDIRTQHSQGFRAWFKGGSPWIWLSATTLSIILLALVALVALVAWQGLTHFWPDDIKNITYENSCEIGPETATTQHIYGTTARVQTQSAKLLREAGYFIPADVTEVEQSLIQVGGAGYFPSDFVWTCDDNVHAISYPENLWSIEQEAGGMLYGILTSADIDGATYISSASEAAQLQTAQVAHDTFKDTKDLKQQITKIEKNKIGKVNTKLENLRLEQRRLALDNQWNETAAARIDAERVAYQAEYAGYLIELEALYAELRKNTLRFTLMDGQEVVLDFGDIHRLTQPNAMHIVQKIGEYFSRIGAFLSENPREANTQGGVFPAIFGTVLMVLLMSVMVTPLGVITALYLHEYANHGWFTRFIRVLINNLAGVPSIVYGIFSLGFFVYFLGTNIDKLFFPEYAPTPVFGTPGLLWASLTLALLTIPVVVVTTEEGLARIPRAQREGSLALGATRYETLKHIILPMCTPAILTGVILAIARAAGEVAPLMLVGVVKLAPSLPIDAVPPFIHIDQKIMHLGFHIFDLGFQSPNVEATRPLVYATALLLLIIIFCLNLAAISVRNHLREKYKALES